MLRKVNSVLKTMSLSFSSQKGLHVKISRIIEQEILGRRQHLELLLSIQSFLPTCLGCCRLVLNHTLNMSFLNETLDMIVSCSEMCTNVTFKQMSKMVHNETCGRSSGTQ